MGFSIGNKGYIGTGNFFTKDFWEWDQATNTWTQKADFGGFPRELAVGFSIGNKGYIGTGWDGSSLKQDFWEYDPNGVAGINELSQIETSVFPNPSNEIFAIQVDSKQSSADNMNLLIYNTL